jgi:threonine aldolase
MMPVETNIVIFTTQADIPAKQIAEKLYQNGVRVIAIATDQIRFVTHLDISEEMLVKTIEIIEKL